MKQLFGKAIVNQFGALSEKNAASLTDSFHWLKDQIATGRQQWKLQEEQRTQEIRGVLKMGLGILGRATPANMVGKSDDLGIADASSSFVKTHYSFTQMLGSMLGPEFAQRWGRAALRGDNAVVDFQLATEKRMEDLMKSIAPQYVARMKLAGWLKRRSIASKYMEGRKVQGVRISIDLAEKIVRGEAITGKVEDIDIDEGEMIMSGDKLPTLSSTDIDAIRSELLNLTPDSTKKYVTIEMAVSQGRVKPITVSPLEAIQHILTWNQPDGRAKMERWGYDQTTINQFASGIGADGAEVYSFLRDEYDSFYEIVNPIYFKLYGMNMPKSDMYAPKRYESSGSAQDQSPFGGMDATGSTPGFAKSIVKHGNMPQTVDALSVYWQHVAQISNFVNFAELNREMASVMMNQEFSNALTQRFGKKVAGELNRWREVVSNSGNNAAADVAVNNWAISAIIGGQAVQALGFNVGTLVKQVDAGLRSPLQLTGRQFANQLKNLATGKLWPDILKMWDAPAVSRRVQQGANPLTRYIYERAKYNPSVLMDGVKASMFPMQFFDGAFTSISAGMVYRAEFDRAKTHGANDTMAEAAAMAAVQDSIDDFAQPMIKTAKSLQENTGGASKRLFTMFMSDQRLKSALFIGAAENLMKGKNKAEAGRQLFTLAVLGLMNAQIVNMLRDVFTDEPDEEIYTWESYLYGVLTAPLGGLFMVGAAMDVAARNITGQSIYSNTNNALARSMQDAFLTVKNYDDFASEDPEKARRAWTRALKAFAILGPVSGIPGATMNFVRYYMGAKANIETED